MLESETEISGILKPYVTLRLDRVDCIPCFLKGVMKLYKPDLGEKDHLAFWHIN
jgi:hypothetical protein